jgi:alkaline phosphatase
VESIITKAEKQNFATGLIATYAIQHATPASFYAHVKNRGDYQTITKQFVESGIDVAFGGGIKHFEKMYKAMGKDYMTELQSRGYKVCRTWNEIAEQTSGQVLGLVSDDNMPDIEERQPDFLADATSKALEILTNNVEQSNNKGFVLMVEGSQIDGRSHDRDVTGILAEMRDFDKAVKVAMDYADAHPSTLVVIVADHETGGLSIPSKKTNFTLPESGIGYNFGTSSHTAAIVPVYLYGACAEQINGIMENIDLSWKLQRLIGVSEK